MIWPDDAAIAIPGRRQHGDGFSEGEFCQRLFSAAAIGLLAVRVYRCRTGEIFSCRSSTIIVRVSPSAIFTTRPVSVAANREVAVIHSTRATATLIPVLFTHIPGALMFGRAGLDRLIRSKTKVSIPGDCSIDWIATFRVGNGGAHGTALNTRFLAACAEGCLSLAPFCECQAHLVSHYVGYSVFHIHKIPPIAVLIDNLQGDFKFC